MRSRLAFIGLAVIVLALTVATIAAIPASHSLSARIHGTHPPTPSNSDTTGIAAPDASSRGVLAANGDGTLRTQKEVVKVVAGLRVHLGFVITNRGTVAARYRVTLSSTTTQLTQHHIYTNITGGASATVSLSIDTLGLAPGIHRVTATLSSNLLDIDELSSTAVVVEIVP